MHHNENLKFLYEQYKSCMRMEFEDNLTRNDKYTSYFDKCLLQKQSIEDYYLSEFAKIDFVGVYDQEHLNRRVEQAYSALNPYGWSDKQIRTL